LRKSTKQKYIKNEVIKMSKQEIKQEITRLQKELAMWQKHAQSGGCYNQARDFYVPYISGAIEQLENKLKEM
jgi:cell division protein FtsB